MTSNFRSLLPLTAILLSAVLPIAALLSVTPAMARPVSGTEPVEVIVEHGDLDLTASAGVAALDRRIRSSVKQACPALTRDLREAAHVRECRKTAAARAATQRDVAIAAAEADRPRLASSTDPKAVAVQ